MFPEYHMSRDSKKFGDWIITPVEHKKKWAHDITLHIYHMRIIPITLLNTRRNQKTSFLFNYKVSVGGKETWSSNYIYILCGMGR